MKLTSKPKIKRKVMLIVLVILALLFACGLQGVITCGESMEPTQHNGDFSLYVNPFNLKPGDVVTFITPEWEKWPEGERVWCKRIVYIEGDKLFLQGDNTRNSHDSRYFGLVDRSAILKKQIVCFHVGKYID